MEGETRNPLHENVALRRRAEPPTQESSSPKESVAIQDRTQKTQSRESVRPRRSHVCGVDAADASPNVRDKILVLAIIRA